MLTGQTVVEEHMKPHADDAAFVAKKRAKSAAAVKRGEPPLRRRHIVLNQFDPWVILFDTDGTWSYVGDGCEEPASLKGIFNSNEWSHVAFPDMATLEKVLPNLPMNVQRLVRIEVDQGEPGVSIILTRDLQTMFWSPVDNPTIDQWQEWLREDLKGLLEELVIDCEGGFSNLKNQHWPFLRQMEAARSVQWSAEDPQWTCTHWLKSLKFSAIAGDLLNDCYHRTGSSKRRNVTERELPDGVYSFCNADKGSVAEIPGHVIEDRVFFGVDHTGKGAMLPLAAVPESVTFPVPSRGNRLLRNNARRQVPLDLLS